MWMCVPPPQTSVCSPGSEQPASDGVWGYSFYNSTGPMIPSGLHIYIYMHIHMHVHIYIFPSLLLGVEQLVKGKLRFGPLVLWGCGLVCAVCPGS